MSEKNENQLMEQLVEQIAAGPPQRDVAWQYLYQRYKLYWKQVILDAGWTATDADRAFSRTIVRVNRLTDNKRVNTKLRKNLLAFLPKAVLDEVVAADFREHRGEKAIPYIRKTWKGTMETKLASSTKIDFEHFDQIFEAALNGMRRRIAEKGLSLGENHMEDHVFDEVLISAINSGEPFNNVALKFIRSHWFHYLTSMVPTPGNMLLKESVFSVAIAGLWKRICRPKNGDSLILEHSLKSYLYKSALREYIHDRKSTNNHQPDDIDRPVESYDNGENAHTAVKTRDSFTHLTKEQKKAIIAQLPERCLQIFTFDGEGYKDKEIAEMLQYKAVGSVKSKRCDCYRQMEDFMEQQNFKSHE